jgi:Protein of unknown function (DUF3141)
MALTEPASTRPAPARMPQQLLKLVADKSTSDRPEATSSDPGQVFRDFADHAINVSERSVLFWDTLRQRAENMMAHDRAGKPPLLDFDYKVVLDARRFERPTNYSLLRITREGIPAWKIASAAGSLLWSSSTRALVTDPGWAALSAALRWAWRLTDLIAAGRRIRDAWAERAFETLYGGVGRHGSDFRA